MLCNPLLFSITDRFTRRLQNAAAQLSTDSCRQLTVHDDTNTPGLDMLYAFILAPFNFRILPFISYSALGIQLHLTFVLVSRIYQISLDSTIRSLVSLNIVLTVHTNHKSCSYFTKSISNSAPQDLVVATGSQKMKTKNKETRCF
jgi:hypothetical protein